MKKKKWIVITLLLLLVQISSIGQQAVPQQQKKVPLIELEGYTQVVFYSFGNEDRAKEIAARCDKAIEYFRQQLDFKPASQLFILGPADWKTYATFPVYGMPHYPDSSRLVIAAEDNDFWRSFLPPLDKLPLVLAAKVKQAYTNKVGQLSMMPFFDLLAMHELGHGFHIQGKLEMQRKWMGELFVNVMLHTYVAENEKGLLPALETFPEMVVAAGSVEYAHTNLEDFEKLYDDMDPKNYGWYQCRLHSAARNIYDAGGKKVLVNLWNVLKQNHQKLTDTEFAELLRKQVHPSVANVYLKW